MKTSLIDRYALILCGARRLVVRTYGNSWMQATLCSSNAPFESIISCVRIVLVGITSGFTQMVNANHEARHMLRAGGSIIEAVQAAKNVGAFGKEEWNDGMVLWCTGTKI